MYRRLYINNTSTRFRNPTFTSKSYSNTILFSSGKYHSQDSFRASSLFQQNTNDATFYPVSEKVHLSLLQSSCTGLIASACVRQLSNLSFTSSYNYPTISIAKRFQSSFDNNNNTNGMDSSDAGEGEDEAPGLDPEGGELPVEDLHEELHAAADYEGDEYMNAAAAAGGFIPAAQRLQMFTQKIQSERGSSTNTSTNRQEQLVKLERVDRLPPKYDLITNSIAYKWETTAKQARKVTGPLREWATELKFRTGVHIEVEPTHPERIPVFGEQAPNAGDADHNGYYKTADEVELTVYLFGSESGVQNCRQLMEEAVKQEPAYVRVGLFRRKQSSSSSKDVDHEDEEETKTNSTSQKQKQNDKDPKNNTGAGEVEWLALRRINREMRPPDIPAISLKTPGKFTLFYETYLEAAIRSVWEETGISLISADGTALSGAAGGGMAHDSEDKSMVQAVLYPTGRLIPVDPMYYWRVPVYYFLAEVPYDVEVRGPQISGTAASYVREFDARLLRNSPDPIDRVWAGKADPETGCAWLTTKEFDELQQPLKGDGYMRTRYTPPPFSELQEVVGFVLPAEELESSADKGNANDKDSDSDSKNSTGEETTKPVGEDSNKASEENTDKKD